MSFDPLKVEVGKVYTDDLGQEILVYAIDGRGGYCYFLTKDLRRPASEFHGSIGKTLIEDVKADPRMVKIRSILEKWESDHPVLEP